MTDEEKEKDKTDKALSQRLLIAFCGLLYSRSDMQRKID